MQKERSLYTLCLKFICTCRIQKVFVTWLLNHLLFSAKQRWRNNAEFYVSYIVFSPYHSWTLKMNGGELLLTWLSFSGHTLTRMRHDSNQSIDKESQTFLWNGESINITHDMKESRQILCVNAFDFSLCTICNIQSN